ncbi:MAG: STT3 domain-containing protein [Candidatus Bathyarchaeia archaeon]|nr:STT3 domain-containing protein [Candidatus Bathyarchaeia archaeon]
MGIRDKLSKENLVNGLKGLGKLRIKISHGSIITFSALLLILFIALTIRLFPMRWEIQTGSMHLSEFDPYFQYRFTEYLVNNGFISWAWPDHWNDTQRWYPTGFDVARAGFIGLPMTTAFLYKIVSALGVNIDLMSFCALMPPIMGMLASLAVYFLGKDIGGGTMGLFAALFLALSPSYIQRTSLGFYDDEIIGILALIVFVFMFMRANEEDKPVSSAILYSLGSGLALGYFCIGWGAAYYPIGLTALFVFVLILLKRYTPHLLLSYSITFGLGLFIAINIPKLTPTYLFETAILPVAGVFALLCFVEVFQTLKSARSKVIFMGVVLATFVSGFGLLWQFRQDIAGKFISVINPFTREGSPLIESVAEHRISAWGSIYYEFGIGIIFFILGLYFILRDLNNKNLFLLIFSLTSLYFACSMVRLLVLMAPAYSLVASTGVVGALKPFNTLLKEQPKIIMKKRYALEHVGKEFSGAAIFLIFLVLMTNFAFPSPRVYKQSYSPVTITAGSLPIVPNKPVNEWLDMLTWIRANLKATDVVVSWWDYGYWLTVLGNVTSLADNATIDTKQIENIGFVFMANETQALKMLETYDPKRTKYILVFTTLALGQTQEGQNYAYWARYGDEGKWMWMARISGKAYDRFVEMGLSPEWTNETAFGEYNSTQNRWIWNARGTNSTIYKLMSWGKHRWCETNSVTEISQETPVEPQYFKEVFFAGLSLSVTDARNKYRDFVPLVCLYEINWQKYHSGQ